MVKVFDGITDLAGAVGTDLGAGNWVLIDQHRVNLFADATEDHQWIHIDESRAAAGPFGGTIAHGFLTLSLLAPLLSELYRVDNVSMVVNYGLNKVRFINPVRVGSKLRASAVLSDVTELTGAVQATFTTTIEIDGEDKPACVAESILRFVA